MSFSPSRSESIRLRKSCRDQFVQANGPLGSHVHPQTTAQDRGPRRCRDLRSRGPGRIPSSAAGRRCHGRGRRTRPGRHPDRGQGRLLRSVEIVQALLDGRLIRKAQLAGERGYMALLVDLEEVRALVRGVDLGGLGSRALADRLRVADKVNPINRCPTVIVTAAEVERFEAEYVSLFVLAKQQGTAFPGGEEGA
jgi:hypothetical protein